LNPDSGIGWPPMLLSEFLKTNPDSVYFFERPSARNHQDVDGPFFHPNPELTAIACNICHIVLVAAQIPNKTLKGLVESLRTLTP